MLFVLLLFTVDVFAAEFPGAPSADSTPGDLCQSSTLRYKERIPYCKRNVSRDEKKRIFENYRKKFGYTLDPAKRHDYKIDHFIPLCAGGSNKQTNLWPQHKTLYQQTDPIEHLGCEKLSQGKITQKELIELIKKSKRDISEASKILKDLKRR